MLMVMNFSFGVNTIMFSRSLIVSMSTVGVLQSHGRIILLPPTVGRTLFGSSFSGL